MPAQSLAIEREEDRSFHALAPARVRLESPATVRACHSVRLPGTLTAAARMTGALGVLSAGAWVPRD
jgi:hypothetical protein